MYLNAILAAIVILVLFEPLRDKVEQYIHLAFFRERVDLERAVGKARRELAHVLEVERDDAGRDLGARRVASRHGCGALPARPGGVRLRAGSVVRTRGARAHRRRHGATADRSARIELHPSCSSRCATTLPNAGGGRAQTPRSKPTSACSPRPRCSGPSRTACAWRSAAKARLLLGHPCSGRRSRAATLSARTTWRCSRLWRCRSPSSWRTRVSTGGCRSAIDSRRSDRWPPVWRTK